MRTMCPAMTRSAKSTAPRSNVETDADSLAADGGRGEIQRLRLSSARRSGSPVRRSLLQPDRPIQRIMRPPPARQLRRCQQSILARRPFGFRPSAAICELSPALIAKNFVARDRLTQRNIACFHASGCDDCGSDVDRFRRSWPRPLASSLIRMDSRRSRRKSPPCRLLR